MLVDYMKSLGYSVDEIVKIINTYPVNRFRLENLLIAIKKIYNFFLQFGYNSEQIRKMTIERPQIFCLEIASFQNKIDNFKTLGLSDREIIKITISFPRIYSYGANSILKKIDEYVELGFKRDIIIKSIKRYPEILGLGLDNVKNKIVGIVNLGYLYEDTIKMISKNMGMLNYKIDNIKNKLDGLVSLGFKYEDALYITKIFPSIFNFTIDYVNSKISACEDLGYTREQSLNIFRRNPSLFGERTERLREKKEFYDMIMLGDIFIIDSSQLKQSIELSYARYMYLTSIGVKLNITDNSYKELFLSNKRFMGKYKISKEDLLKKYDYSLVKEKKGGRVI